MTSSDLYRMLGQFLNTGRGNVGANLLQLVTNLTGVEYTPLRTDILRAQDDLAKVIRRA